MQGAKKLVAIVVTYNRLDKLRATLQRLLDHPEQLLSGCLVFDNASNDGTGAYLSSITDPRLSVIESEKNVGGAGGFASAMRAAVEHFDPDWIVLMDDDARPDLQTFENFFNMDCTGVDGLAAKVTYPNGTLCDMNRPWLNPFGSVGAFAKSLVRGRDGFHITGNETVNLPVDGGSFVGLFLSRDVISKVGVPDADLFIYGDDVLFTLSMTQAGLALHFAPRLVFEHDCETVTSVGTMFPLWKAYFYHRNQIFVYRKAAGPLLYWPLLVLRIALWWMRAGRYQSDSLRYKRLLRMAVRDGIKGRKDRNRGEIESLLAGVENP